MNNMNDLSSREIVRKIRQARVARKYSQEYMAARMGISQASYSRLELHESTPRLDRFLAIARILGIHPEEFLLTREPEPGTPQSLPPGRGRKGRTRFRKDKN